MIGGFITCVTMPLLDKIGIDDPVGASATHGYCFIITHVEVFLNITQRLNALAFSKRKQCNSKIFAIDQI